jgi:hypothetical protein
VEVDTRDEVITTLQEQLALAHANVARLNAKLARIGRLARLELLPLAANTSLTQLVNEDPARASPAVRESDIVASEKRLRSTLALVLAESERSSSDDLPSGDRVKDSLSGALAVASSMAGSALASTTKEMRAKSERVVTDSYKNKCKSSTPTKTVEVLAGRMNLDVPTASLASSSSLPSPLSSPLSSTSSGAGSPGPSGSSPLPPRKILTPQERTEMLQQEFLDTEETYYKSLRKLHDVRYHLAPLVVAACL